MLTLREVTCKTLLNKSGLADYTLNCYVGCSHRCIYCYARYIKRFKPRIEGWGEFVDIKINAPQVLSKEVLKLKPGSVFMSSICDGWQPIEAKYKLSRQCLKILLEAGFSPDILTKSSLILRDFDLLKAYKTPRLGMTITTLNYKLYKALEPYTSTPDDRLEALEKAQNQGIKRYVFLGPLIPELTDTKENLEPIFAALKGLDLDEILVDKLNLRWGVLESLKKGLAGQVDYPKLKLLIYQAANPTKYAQFTSNLRGKVKEIAHQFNLSKRITICF